MGDPNQFPSAHVPKIYQPLGLGATWFLDVMDQLLPWSSFSFLNYFLKFFLLMEFVHRIHFATRNPPAPSILLRHYLNVKFYPFPKTSKEQNVRMLTSWRICDLMETKSRLICISVPPIPSLSSFFFFSDGEIFNAGAPFHAIARLLNHMSRAYEHLFVCSFPFFFWLLATVAFCLFPRVCCESIRRVNYE